MRLNPPILILVVTLLLPGCRRAFDVEDPTDLTPGADWIWTDTTGGSAITPGFDSARRVIYTVTTDRELLALRSTTGTILWRKRYWQGFPNGSNIAVAGDIVALGDVDVWGFRASTGELLWQLSRPEGNDGQRQIATDGSTFFLGGRDGKVQRITAANVTVLWSRQLMRADSSIAAFGPTLIGPTLFVCGVKFGGADGTGTLFALDAATGEQRWRYDYTPALPGQSSKCYSRVSRSGNLIISAQDDGRIFAHDVATGEVRWTAPRVHSPPGDPSGPGTGPYDDRRLVTADAEHVVASSDDGTVVCYSVRDGTQLWRTRGSGAALDPPVLVSGMALVIHSGFAVAYDLRTGAALWRRPILDPNGVDRTRFLGQPVVFGDTLILTGWTGTRARLLSRR